MTTKRHWGVMLLVGCGLAAALSACGGDDDKGGTVSSGVAGSKTLNGLSADETKKLCGSVDDAVAANLDLFCEVFAIATEATKEQCIEVRDDCLGPNPEDSDADLSLACDDPSSASALSSCSVTVSEYETCVNDSLKELRAAGDKISCDNAGDTALLATFDRDPESCKAVYAKCPDLE